MKLFDPVRWPALVVLMIVIFAGCLSSTAQPTVQKSFLQVVQIKVADGAACELSAACACSMVDEQVASRLLAEYGSMFVAAETVRLPKRCMFDNGSEVSEFQSGLRSQSAVMDGVIIELQEKAMAALLAARQEAARAGARLTPFDGTAAAKRSYTDTIRIWNSRYLKALDHWVQLGKISVEDAGALRFAPFVTQIKKVMEWERSGFYFGTSLSRSIFSSTAPPGTSQHLSMLAFDVVQNSDPDVRRILNSHGWFQTIANDPPHFTYLGVPESELPARGLKAVYLGNLKYWVPDMTLPAPVAERPAVRVMP